jgi:hypothetical protein
MRASRPWPVAAEGKGCAGLLSALWEAVLLLLLGREEMLSLSPLPGAKTCTSSAALGSHLLSMQEGVRQGGQLVAESAKACCICASWVREGVVEGGGATQGC